MIRFFDIKTAFTRIPNGAEHIDFESRVMLPLSQLLGQEKVLALVRTPNGKTHGDFFTIFENLVRDEDGNIVFFNPGEKYEPWHGLALALDDSDTDQGRKKRNFRFGLVEIDVSKLNQAQLSLKMITETIDFGD